MEKKIAFHTLGCKLNFSETSSIARSFYEAGYRKAKFEEAADVYVINTCSVTDHADRKCRKAVQQALRQSPHAFVAVIGCYAQLKPAEIACIPGVDIVLGASEKFNLPEYIGNAGKKFRTKIFAEEIKHCNSFEPAFSSGDRTRSFLKIQDGCDYFCSFCTIPLARGISRSDTIEGTLRSARKAAATGAKEIVLTGVNTGDFGRNNGESFSDLIRELDLLEDIKRIRISSIEPNLLSDDIIRFVASSRLFMPHFHIPLQSGSDKVLGAMRRRYGSSLYAQKVQTIKSLMPHSGVGVDVIVGFPGETEEDFLMTYRFINDLDVSYLHVFTYSERPGTTAVRMKDVVPASERNRRSRMLHILSDKKRRAFCRQHEGKTEEVLFEQEHHEGMMHGFTRNYIKVKRSYDPALVNEIRQVTLGNMAPDGMVPVQETLVYAGVDSDNEV